MSSTALPVAVYNNASPISQLSHSIDRPNTLLFNCFALIPPSSLCFPILHQPYQSRQSQYAYQYAEEKRVYQNNNKNFENHCKSFYITFDSVDKEVNYSEKSFEEVIINFVGIEIVCLPCNSSFFSKLQLHKHLKAGYTKVMQAMSFIPTQPALSIFIVKLKVIISLLGLNLAFRG